MRMLDELLGVMVHDAECRRLTPAIRAPSTQASSRRYGRGTVGHHVDAAHQIKPLPSIEPLPVMLTLRMARHAVHAVALFAVQRAPLISPGTP